MNQIAINSTRAGLTGIAALASVVLAGSACVVDATESDSGETEELDTIEEG